MRALLLVGVIALSTSLVGVVNGDNPHIVVHYNAGQPFPAAGQRLLYRWDEGDAMELEKLGYKRVSIDEEIVFFVDPMAPPIQEIYQQRVLLEELAPGQAKRFGDLSPAAQRIVRPGKPVSLRSRASPFRWGSPLVQVTGCQCSRLCSSALRAANGRLTGTEP